MNRTFTIIRTALRAVERLARAHADGGPRWLTRLAAAGRSMTTIGIAADELGLDGVRPR